MSGKGEKMPISGYACNQKVLHWFNRWILSIGFDSTFIYDHCHWKVSGSASQCFFTSFPSHICFVSVWFYFKYCIIIKLISNITYYMNRIQSAVYISKKSIFSGFSNKLSGKKWCRKKLVLKFMARTDFFWRKIKPTFVYHIEIV